MVAIDKDREKDSKKYENLVYITPSETFLDADIGSKEMSLEEHKILWRDAISPSE